MTRAATQEERWDHDRDLRKAEPRPSDPPSPTITVSIDYLGECFNLNAEHGVLVWKTRPLAHFTDARTWNTFNTRFSGRLAGSLSPTGYFDVCVDDQKIRIHRIVWAMHTGAWPVDQIDHIDNNKANNRIENLREATRSQNMANQPASPKNKLGLKGVCAHGNRFRAQIKTRTKVIFLGIFDTPELAHEAYCRAARECHGEFAGGLDAQT